MLSRIKFRIEPLVNEILHQLPAEVWSSKTTTFFDPAMGGGQFVREIERKLREFGHSDKNISGRVYGCETSRLAVQSTINKYKLVGTYSVGDFLAQDFGDMKFDIIVGNPPYQGKAETHQKFFNKAVALLQNNGIVTFIQPATPYFNKKETVRSNASEMLCNVQKYKTNIKIVKGSVFQNAGIFTSLAITQLTKKENKTGNIDTYINESGKIYNNISIKSVNMLEMEPAIYDSLVKKIFNKIAKNGSLQDLVTSNIGEKKLYVQKVRGHIGHIDFYTFLSKDKKYWKLDENAEYGLKVKSQKELQFMVEYLTSFVARFCLAIYKFNGNNHMGEFRSVPIVPFNQSWDDKKLCDYFGITQAEFKEIMKCIPKYYE